MAWIESHQGTRKHPKTNKFRRLLDISRVEAIGHLHLLWWWVMEYAPQGDLTDIDAEEIADAMEYKGDAQQLMEALIESGYVDETQEGREVHNWFRYAGKLIERREKDAARKRGERAGEPSSTSRPADVQRTSKGRVKESISDLDPNPNLYPNHIPKQEPGVSPFGPTPEPGTPNQTQNQNPEAEQPASSENPPEKSENGEKTGKAGKKGSKSRKKPEYPPDSPYLKMAVYFKEQIDKMAAAEGLANLTIRTNIQSWADTFRLLVEEDEQDNFRLIQDVIDWVVKDPFWKLNCQSAKKLREKFPTFALATKEAQKKAATPNKGSGGGGRGYGNQKPHIPISQPDPDAPKVSDEEHAALMAKAAEYQAKKEREEQERRARLGAR